MKDKDDEDNLALFLDIRNDDLFDAPPGSEAGCSPTFKVMSTPKSVGDKNDYDWLLTPPAAPFISSTEMQKSSICQNGSPKVCPVEVKPRLTDYELEPASKGTSPSKQFTPPSLDSSSVKSCGTSSSDSQISTISKPESTTDSRATLLLNKSSRLMPTSRTSISSSSERMVPSTRPTASSARSSSPTPRHIVPLRKSISRSGTPTMRPNKPLTAFSASAPPGRSSSVSKSGSSITRNITPSRGSSTVKSRPQKPAEMPGLSTDAPQDSKMSMTKKPVSASISRCQTSESNERSKRCSNGRPYSSGGLFPAVRRTRSNEGDDVSPVQIGNNMVDRVVNSRKLAPPKKDNQSAGHPSGKPSSHTSLGFGRTLSKSSLEMALRHMDIGKGLTENLRPLKTKVQASSLLNTKSGAARGRSTGVSDSPLATRSNASSVLSANSITLSFDASEPDDDLGR